MKILLLTEFFPKTENGQIPGGSEARTFHLAKELVELGHKVTVLTAFLPGAKREENWAGIKIIRVGKQYDYVQSGSNLSRLVFAISCILSGWKEDFDIVDANNTAVYMAAFILAKTKLKKVVYWVPDLLGLSGWTKVLGTVNGGINAFNEALSMLLTPDKTIALSKATAKKINSPSVIIYPGVSSVSQKKLTFLPLTIISVNRLVDYKRNDLVVKALGILSHKGVDMIYEVVGEGEEKENLERLVKNLKLDKQVRFLGNLPKAQVLKKMAKAQIFCLASEIEGFGIVTLEAMSSGVPFVNSDIPVHMEIERMSNAGLLFKSGDENELAAKIEQLVEKKSLYERLSRNALAFTQKHTWRQVAIDTLKIYKNI